MLVRTMADPNGDPICSNCEKVIEKLTDHFNENKFPQWKCRAPGELNPQFKCPNCKEVVSDIADHFFGGKTWTCRKKRVRIDKGPDCYHFDTSEKWEIVIHANGKEWKTITCNGNGSISEFKIEQTDIFAQKDEHVDDTLREMGFKL